MSVKTVTQFVKVTRARQPWVVWTPILIEIDSRPFPDYTNTSALIAQIYWCVMVITLHLTTKWPQSLHSSIFSDAPKATLINQLIHTQPCSVQLCLIHLCLSLSNLPLIRSSFVFLPQPLLHIPHRPCSCGVLCLGYMSVFLIVWCRTTFQSGLVLK